MPPLPLPPSLHLSSDLPLPPPCAGAPLPSQARHRRPHHGLSPRPRDLRRGLHLPHGRQQGVCRQGRGKSQAVNKSQQGGTWRYIGEVQVGTSRLPPPSVTPVPPPPPRPPPSQVALGLVIGLDYSNPNLNTHKASKGARGGTNNPRSMHEVQGSGGSGGPGPASCCY